MSSHYTDYELTNNIAEIAQGLIEEATEYYASADSYFKQAKKDAVSGEGEDFLAHLMAGVAAKTNGDQKRHLADWYNARRFRKEEVETFSAREEYLDEPLF